MKLTIVFFIILLIIVTGCDKECIQQCEDQPDGSPCSTGVWYDDNCRICGGQSCASMGVGECKSGECVSE